MAKKYFVFCALIVAAFVIVSGCVNGGNNGEKTSGGDAVSGKIAHSCSDTGCIKAFVTTQSGCDSVGVGTYAENGHRMTCRVGEKVIRWCCDGSNCIIYDEVYDNFPSLPSEENCHTKLA